MRQGVTPSIDNAVSLPRPTHTPLLRCLLHILRLREKLCSSFGRRSLSIPFVLSPLFRLSLYAKALKASLIGIVNLNAWHNATQYHSAENNYRCKSLLNSKTISAIKKYRIILAGLINSKNYNVRMKLQTLQILQIFIECKIMVGGASVHISKHSLFRPKITVGCRLCAYPSIRVYVYLYVLCAVCCWLCC